MKPGLCIMLALIGLAGFSCDKEKTEVGAGDTPGVTLSEDTLTAGPDNVPFAIFDTVGPDSPGEFQRKRELLLATVPSQRSRIEFVLKDVSKIILFEELGLGERIELVSPASYTRGWPSGISCNRRWGNEKATLAVRFVIDTLPGPRLAGMSRLTLLGPHCADEYGPDITFPGLYAGQGAVTLFFQNNMPYVEVACCDQGPQMALSGFGAFGDTLMALYTFDPQRLEYGIQLIGPRSSRGFPRFGYVNFRTERGGLHPEVADFPYVCQRTDSSSVDLTVGISRRQRFEQFEPRLRVTIF